MTVGTTDSSGKGNWDNFEGFSGNEKESTGKFSFDNFISENKFPVILFLIGLIVAGFGVLLYKNDYFAKDDEVQVLNASAEGQGINSKIMVEVSGAVEKPGVYEFDSSARVNDALVAAGGLSGGADREWVDRIINKAAKLTDGQKVYIPTLNEQTATSTANNTGGDQTISSTNAVNVQGLININTASSGELESLNGIGPVYAKKIVEYRPYSSVEELLSKKVIPNATYDKIKDAISIY